MVCNGNKITDSICRYVGGGGEVVARLDSPFAPFGRSWWAVHRSRSGYLGVQIFQGLAQAVGGPLSFKNEVVEAIVEALVEMYVDMALVIFRSYSVFGNGACQTIRPEPVSAMHVMRDGSSRY
jgi:hypothetical protein